MQGNTCNIMFSVTTDTVFLQIFLSLLIITPTYIEATYGATNNKLYRNSKLKMNENFKLPTKHDML
jgi:hypothetical protein